MIKLEYYEDSEELYAYNVFEIQGEKHYEYLGNIDVKEMDDQLMEFDHPSARPRFGGFLYQMAAMYATSLDKYLCLPREGDLRQPAFDAFDKIFHNGSNKISSVDVHEDYNEEYYQWTDEEETPSAFKAIQIELTDGFKEAITTYENRSESPVPQDILKEWQMYFTYSYENDSNKWLDVEEELVKPLNLDHLLAFKHKVKKGQKNKKTNQYK